MPISQMKVETKPYKADEFISSTRLFLRTIRKKRGCHNFNMYRDSENENAFIAVGEWKTHEAMEKYFHSKEFKLIRGAAKVLGETFSMNIAEVSKTGGIELAREQIASKQKSLVAD